ncbi:ubiquitin carboxyl-terminal hydrolase 47-like [Pempheris klunzingeri]|uniref:ubiquitin carboxyl-terminal hydrolase 47-like n=1 Tax=Pempheris klunzingeri TaxID=3127111 RepID=UPI00397FB207
MNHDLVEMFIGKLNNFTVSDYHGLQSPGLTCYLNSVLQVLFMTEDFREAVGQCCSKDSTTIDPHLGKLFSDLQKGTAKTHNITKQLGITNVYEQRDAAEYLEKILSLTSPEAAKIFKGVLSHRTTCLKCKETNDSRSFFVILPLAVEDSCCETYSVEKGLEAFFKGEKVSGDNKMYCNRCNKKRDADFGCEITQNPVVLTLLLKRFSFDYKRRCFVKLHCNVDVPQTLHMKNCTYDLYAVVTHFGNLAGGHYISLIKSFETQKWYHFNDDVVKGVEQPLFEAGDKYLRSSTAYLLMYRKVSRNSDKTDEGCARSDDEAEREEAPAPRYQLKNESCNLTRWDGDILKWSHDYTALTELPNFLWDLEKKERAASVRPHEETLLPIETGADRDGLETQTSNFGREMNEPFCQELDEEHVWHPNTRGTHHVEQTHACQKKRLKVNQETQNSIVAKTETTRNVTVTRLIRNTNRVTPAEIKVDKNQKEADVSIEGKNEQRREAGVCANMSHSDVNSGLVSSNGYSSSSVPYPRPTGCSSSPNACRKSASSERDEWKMQPAVSADSSCKLDTAQAVTKGDTTVSQREKRNAAKSRDKVTRKPWR